MIAVWILLGIAALIVLLLVLPLRIYLHYDPQSGLQYQVRYALLTLADSSKPKKPKEEKKPAAKKPASAKKPAKEKKKKSGSGKSPVSSLLSFLGLDDISTAAKAKQSISEKGLLETVGNVFAALKDLFSRIFRLAGKGFFRSFDLSIVVGDSDAADAAFSYGTICAAVYPLLTLLDSAMKFRDRNVDIRCDYEQPATTARFDGQFCYRPCHVLGFAFGLIWRYIRQTIRKEGNKS